MRKLFAGYTTQTVKSRPIDFPLTHFVRCLETLLIRDRSRSFGARSSRWLEMGARRSKVRMHHDQVDHMPGHCDPSPPVDASFCRSAGAWKGILMQSRAGSKRRHLASVLLTAHLGLGFPPQPIPLM